MPRPKRKSNALLTLADRVEQVDARIAAMALPFDASDSVRDRLFALVMQRIDVLQEDRDVYVEILAALVRKPTDARQLAMPLQKSLQTMLKVAGADASAVHVAMFGVAYTAVIAVWRNDTSADLSKTMKACDKALGVLENIAAFV